MTSTIRSLLTAVALVALAGATAHAEPATKVFLNGVPAPVFFNDGDSFRVLGGAHAGGKARLAGFNSLESHGPVHQWGGWTYKEMYVLAKMATNHARNGVWSCTTEGDTDTYGRVLWFCPDLAESLVRAGLAHAMSVTEEPAEARLLEAQRDAIAARRGIWAHGVPDFVLTSIHSADEDPTREWHYNRLVSSTDGSSLKWQHKNTYAECQAVCDEGLESDTRVARAVAAVRADAPDVAGGYEDAQLATIARAWVKGEPLAPHVTDPAHDAPLTEVFEGLREQRAFGRKEGPSCMIHVDFNRRFGGGKAACLK